MLDCVLDELGAGIHVQLQRDPFLQVPLVGSNRVAIRNLRFHVGTEQPSSPALLECKLWLCPLALLQRRRQNLNCHGRIKAKDGRSGQG